MYTIKSLRQCVTRVWTQGSWHGRRFLFRRTVQTKATDSSVEHAISPTTKFGSVKAGLSDFGSDLVLCLKAGCFIYFFSNYVVSSTMCIGPSMIPTMCGSGSVVLQEHISPRFGSIRDGDVVIARPPYNKDITVCKRVRATAGETARMENAQTKEVSECVVPAGHVWLEGDNPENSKDSRSYGAVPTAMIIGKVFFHLWPPSEFGFTRQQAVDHSLNIKDVRSSTRSDDAERKQIDDCVDVVEAKVKEQLQAADRKDLSGHPFALRRSTHEVDSSTGGD